jgi:hypothetical protein
MFRSMSALVVAALASLAACAADDSPALAVASQAAASCGSQADSLTLSNGSCAILPAGTIDRVRQAVVTASGDAYVALADPQGGVLALRDADGDGVLETQLRFGPGGGTGMALHADVLYFGQDTRVLSWNLANLPSGDLKPHLQPITIVSGMPAAGAASDKSLGFDDAGKLLVDLADTHAGMWRFSATDEWQTMAQGERVN